MSADGVVGRARLLQRARVGPGPLREFKDAMYELYLLDPVTLDQLENRIRLMADASLTNPGCEPMATPRRDTIRSVISDTVLPQNVHVVTAVVAGLVFYRHNDLKTVSVLEDSTVRRIRDLWSRAAAQRPIGRPIRDLRSVEDLEVHAVGAVDEDGLAVLPPYIERSHDEALHELVRRALAGHSGIGIMISDSTSGKTRAIAEALRWVPDPKIGSLATNGWRLWPSHAPTPSCSQTLLEEMPFISPRTVVWLNEAQRLFLDSGTEVSQRIAIELRVMLTDPTRHPVLILGTLWPDYWQQLTKRADHGQPDPNAVIRLLMECGGIRVENVFAASDLEVARATGDHLLIEAVDHAEDGELAQYLAGVPEILSRYALASTADRAVIHAAMDARRLGRGEWLSADLLKDAAAAYLSATHRRRLNTSPDWFTDTIANLTRLGKADTCILIPGPNATYRLEDYLDQYGRRIRCSVVPPDHFWDAIAAHTADFEVLHKIAHNAVDRFRFKIAARLLTAGSENGHLASAKDLALLLEAAGHHDDAEQIAQRVASVEGFDFWVALAEVRAWVNSDQEGAVAMCYERVDKSDLSQLSSIGRFLEDVGETQGAMSMYRKVAEKIDSDETNVSFIDDLLRIRENVRAEQIAIRAAESGDGRGFVSLLIHQHMHGDSLSAERTIERALDAGLTDGLGEWITVGRDLPERIDRLEFLAQRVAAAGDPRGIRAMSELRVMAGDYRMAQEFALEAMVAGDMGAMDQLIWIWEKQGRGEIIDRVFKKFAENGISTFWGTLARRKINQREFELAEGFARLAAENGHQEGISLQAIIRELMGDQEQAEIFAETAGKGGNYLAVSIMVTERERRDQSGAEELAVRALSWSTNVGVVQLAKKRQDSGDLASAERLARLAADTGWRDALDDIVNDDEEERWMQIRRFGLNADGSESAPW